MICALFLVGGSPSRSINMLSFQSHPLNNIPHTSKQIFKKLAISTWDSCRISEATTILSCLQPWSGWIRVSRSCFTRSLSHFSSTWNLWPVLNRELSSAQIERILSNVSYPSEYLIEVREHLTNFINCCQYFVSLMPWWKLCFSDLIKE